MIKTAIILSAGAGVRLRPLTLLQPKPLFPVLNKTMLEWWAEFLASAGLKRVIINAHYQAPLMLERIESLAAAFKNDLEIIASPEEEVLGTGGAIKKAAELLGKNEFLVVNADIFTDFDLVKLALKHLANPGRIATLGLLENQDKDNVSMGEGGRILTFRSPEPLPNEIGRTTYCGAMSLSPEIFDYLPEGASDIIEVFIKMIGEGCDICGWTYDPAIWSDMGTSDDYWQLNRTLAAGRSIVHSTAVVEGTLSGWNVVGASARVHEEATVENCVLWPSAVVLGGASVKNALVTGTVAAGSHVEGGVHYNQK